MCNQYSSCPSCHFIHRIVQLVITKSCKGLQVRFLECDKSEEANEMFKLIGGIMGKGLFEYKLI